MKPWALRAGRALVAASFIGMAGLAHGAETAEQRFAARCAGCHALAVEDGDRWQVAFERKGPPLWEAGDKFQPGFLQQWLANPVPLRAGHFPYFRWTEVGADGDRFKEVVPRHVALPADEAQGMATYLATQRGRQRPLPPTAPVAPHAARVMYEKVAACEGCHAGADREAPRSGPALGDVAARYAPGWLASYLMEPQASGQLNMPRPKLRTDQAVGVVQHMNAATAGRTLAAAQDADPALPADAAAAPRGRGALIYRMLCTQCHGLQGDGRGVNARHLTVEPRNHRSAEMDKLSDDHLYRVVRYGGTAVDKSALMPAWGSVLREDEILDVVAHVRTLGRGANQAASADNNRKD